MAKFTYAIMGATGHVGHGVVEELLKKGHKVRAIGRDARKLRGLKEKGAEIFSGECTDTAFLTRAFKGCHAVFSFIPPSHKTGDFEVFRDNTGKAIAHAIEKAKISHVINLSSLGAALPTSTGLIKELHLQEERLNAIPDLNVLHFRANYFMENLLWSLPSIKSSGIIASSLKADLPIAMVATGDIALKIAEFFGALKFKGSSVFELIGPRAVTMAEATKVIGKAIDKPDLKYVHLSHDQAEERLIDSGMKHQLAKLLVDMWNAFNEGKIAPTQKMTAEHSGKTTIEEFAKTFLQIYRSVKKAA